MLDIPIAADPINLPKVINLKRKNTQNGAYCGRGSDYGNPYPMKQYTKEERNLVCNRHIYNVGNNDDLVRQIKSQLKGVNLKCYCAPQRCHCDFLLLLANWE